MKSGGTGEMSQSEVTREAFPLHFAVADKIGGEVRAFDQYRGPYISTRKYGRLWIGYAEKKCEHCGALHAGDLVLWTDEGDEVIRAFNDDDFLLQVETL